MDIPTSFQPGSRVPVAAFFIRKTSRSRSLESRFQGRPRRFRTMPAKSRRSFSVRFWFTRSRELNQRDLPTSQAIAHGMARPRVQSLLNEGTLSRSPPSSRFLLHQRFDRTGAPRPGDRGSVRWRLGVALGHAGEIAGDQPDDRRVGASRERPGGGGALDGVFDPRAGAGRSHRVADMQTPDLPGP